MTDNFGPDNNLPNPKEFSFSTDPRFNYYFQFSFKALHENAVCIYDGQDGTKKLIERGNYGRNDNSLESKFHGKEIATYNWLE